MTAPAPSSASAGRVFMDRAELSAELERVRTGRVIVFTNGCFDLLHVGHLTYLERARSLGDLLVVGVNSDDSVRRLGKGPGRPLNAAADRALVLAGLRCVDYVTVFGEDTPVQTLELLKPGIHTKGGDYLADELPEAAAVRAYGGRVEILPFVEGYSTTALIEAGRAADSGRTD